MSLVTLEEVTNFLQGSSAQDDEDKDLLETFIRAVGRAFRNHTHREFEPTSDEERVFAHHGGLLLNLAPYDLRSLDVITTGVEAGGTPTTVAAGGYALRPLPARDGVYQWVKLTTDPGECEVSLKGDWGFAEVPPDIKHWALTQIALWMRRDIQAYERTFNIDGGFFERPEALSSAVRGGLADFRRMVLP